MIISILDYSAGFYSQLHFTINHYLWCKLNEVNFMLHSTNWLFRFKNGWTDYFEDNSLIFKNADNEIVYKKHSDTTGDFSLIEYRNIISEFYRYNKTTKQAIIDTKIKYNIPETYDCIFIRRGDKLYWESIYIHSSKFLDLLIEKNPDCKNVFLQTDDYNCYLELQEYIKEKNYDIQVITLCDEKNKGGVVVYEENIDNGLAITQQQNNETGSYISTVINNLKETKSVNRMTLDEKYEHTLTMIIGVDIAIHSNICVCDYSSNVARFIKLAHNNNEKVYDILNPDLDIDMNRTECPAFGNFR